MPGQGRVKDNAQVPACSHGALCCPHPAIGPGTMGSANVFTNGKPSLRLGDPGQHSSCCGAQAWVAAAGSGTVMINGIPSHRQGDKTQHCGGVGMLVVASTNVIVGG